MPQPRSWLLSEVNVAARAILAREKSAARARMLAGTPCRNDIGSSATAITAALWGRKRLWLESVLRVCERAAAEPERFGGLVALMDAAGTPQPAIVRILAGTADADALPAAGSGTPRAILSAAWKPSDVNLAAQALLAATHDSGVASASSTREGGRRHRQTLTAIARLWGEGADWLLQILDVCAAAEADPDRFGHLVALMDRSENPSSARKEMVRARDEHRVLALAPVSARFRTLVVDPPWQEDNISRGAGHDYATMPFSEIMAMPVADWAEENAHLYLWATNNTLPLGFQLLKAWGFAHKTAHTWTKPRLGLGRYFRNTTEHVIFAVRGELRTRMAARSVRTDHDWPVGENSVKPEGFYDLVRACSYPPFGEAFQRTVRPDFRNLYETQPAPAALLEAAE